jgi:hypothetical protein
VDNKSLDDQQVVHRLFNSDDNRRSAVFKPRFDPHLRYYRPTSPQEQALYDHLLHWIEQESPTAMIERFRALFINGTGYSDPDVLAALKAVVASPIAPEEFRYVLNRCCHILINRWQARSQTQAVIPDLIDLFDSPQPVGPSSSHSAAIRRLHQLVQQFRETEQYQTLQRLAQVVTESESALDRPLGSLIRRYPYLYEHCLLSEDSTQEQQSTVRQLQSTMQRQFEVNLAHYVTHQARFRCPDLRAQRLIRPVSNPTLLDDQELHRALHYYTGKVDGRRSHRDQALNLLAGRQTFAAFKDDLYEYITMAIEPGYGRRKFNNRFYGQLVTLFPEHNAHPLNDFLLVRTCNCLLSFLIVDSPQRPQHYVFVDLINNLGAIVTTGLLLKVVLLCRKVIPSLERRLSILFNHYETDSREAVQWLVQALENTHLALTTNFGSVKLTLLPGLG